MQSDVNNKNFTLLIAGPFHSNTGVMIDRNSGAFDTVLSTWMSSQVPEEIRSRSAVVLSSPPEPSFLKAVHNAQNIYFQSCTVLAGLQQVSTPYVIKTRSDEYFSNLKDIVPAFDKKKLLTSNIFVRDASYRPFHISDHLFIGETSRLRDSFAMLKQWLESNAGGPFLNDTTPAEVKIAVCYLTTFGYRLDELASHSPGQAFDVMQKKFDLFDVRKAMPYEISSSAVGKIHDLDAFMKKDLVLRLHPIKNISQMKPKSPAGLLAWRIRLKVREMVARKFR